MVSTHILTLVFVFGHLGLPVKGDKNECLVTQWSDWSSCTGVCHRGRRVRTRRVTRPPLISDITLEVAPCPHLYESKGCTRRCTAEMAIEHHQLSDYDVERCRVGDWAPWGQCEGDCAHAWITRSRVVLHPALPPELGHFEPKPCPELYEARGCRIKGCPDKDRLMFVHATSSDTDEDPDLQRLRQEFPDLPPDLRGLRYHPPSRTQNVDPTPQVDTRLPVLIPHPEEQTRSSNFETVDPSRSLTFIPPPESAATRADRTQDRNGGGDPVFRLLFIPPSTQSSRGQPGTTNTRARTPDPVVTTSTTAQRRPDLTTQTTTTEMRTTTTTMEKTKPTTTTTTTTTERQTTTPKKTTATTTTRRTKPTTKATTRAKTATTSKTAATTTTDAGASNSERQRDLAKEISEVVFKKISNLRRKPAKKNATRSKSEEDRLTVSIPLRGNPRDELLTEFFSIVSQTEAFTDQDYTDFDGEPTPNLDGAHPFFSSCRVGPWQQWGPCHGSCPLSWQVRHRLVVQPVLLRADRPSRGCPSLYEVQLCHRPDLIETCQPAQNQTEFLESILSEDAIREIVDLENAKTAEDLVKKEKVEREQMLENIWEAIGDLKKELEASIEASKATPAPKKTVDSAVELLMKELMTELIKLKSNITELARNSMEQRKEVENEEINETSEFLAVLEEMRTLIQESKTIIELSSSQSEEKESREETSSGSAEMKVKAGKMSEKAANSSESKSMEKTMEKLKNKTMDSKMDEKMTDKSSSMEKSMSSKEMGMGSKKNKTMRGESSSMESSMSSSSKEAVSKVDKIEAQSASNKTTTAKNLVGESMMKKENSTMSGNSSMSMSSNMTKSMMKKNETSKAADSGEMKEMKVGSKSSSSSEESSRKESSEKETSSSSAESSGESNSDEMSVKVGKSMMNTTNATTTSTASSTLGNSSAVLLQVEIKEKLKSEVTLTDQELSAYLLKLLNSIIPDEEALEQENERLIEILLARLAENKTSTFVISGGVNGTTKPILSHTTAFLERFWVTVAPNNTGSGERVGNDTLLEKVRGSKEGSKETSGETKVDSMLIKTGNVTSSSLAGANSTSNETRAAVSGSSKEEVLSDITEIRFVDVLLIDPILNKTISTKMRVIPKNVFNFFDNVRRRPVKSDDDKLKIREIVQSLRGELRASKKTLETASSTEKSSAEGQQTTNGKVSKVDDKTSDSTRATGTTGTQQQKTKDRANTETKNTESSAEPATKPKVPASPLPGIEASRSSKGLGGDDSDSRGAVVLPVGNGQTLWPGSAIGQETVVQRKRVSSGADIDLAADLFEGDKFIDLHQAVLSSSAQQSSSIDNLRLPPPTRLEPASPEDVRERERLRETCKSLPLKEACPDGSPPQRVVRWYYWEKKNECNTYVYSYCGAVAELLEKPLRTKDECSRTCDDLARPFYYSTS